MMPKGRASSEYINPSGFVETLTQTTALSMGSEGGENPLTSLQSRAGSEGEITLLCKTSV